MKREEISRTCSIVGGYKKFVFRTGKTIIMLMEVIISFYKSQQRFCNRSWNQIALGIFVTS
jgi:hypothetical protein